MNLENDLRKAETENSLYMFYGKKIGHPATNCSRFFNGFRLCNVSLITHQKSQKNPITGSYQKTGIYYEAPTRFLAPRPVL